MQSGSDNQRHSIGKSPTCNPTSTHSSGAKVSEHGKTKRCKVIGCSVDLQLLGRAYCWKKHICPDHLKADAIRCEGMGNELWRFCQQCGKLELLEYFEGTKRSCRLSLSKRRQQASDSKQKGNNRQQQQQQQQQAALVEDAAAGGTWGSSCCVSGGSDGCSDTTEAALAAAWCEYEQEQHALCLRQQLSRNSSNVSSATWPPAASAGSGGVYTAECAIRAAAAAGNAYNSSVPTSPVAAAALPSINSSCCFPTSPSGNNSMFSSDLDGCEDAVLDWMLEIEGELLAAGILADSSSADVQQQQQQQHHPWSCQDTAAVPSALPQQQPGAAGNNAHPKPLLTTLSCGAVAAPATEASAAGGIPAAAAAAAPQIWAPVNVTASQQLPYSCAAPVMPTAQLVGPGTSFTATAVPGAAGPSMLYTLPGAAVPQGGDRYNVVDTKLQALAARFGQLQHFMNHLQQLRQEAAALNEWAAAAAAPAAPGSQACAGW